MSDPQDLLLNNTVIVTSTSEPAFLSGSGPLTWQDLVSSPEVQGVDWIDTPLEVGPILEVVRIFEPELSDRGIDHTIVREYDFYDHFDPNIVDHVLRHVHLIVPVLKDAKEQLQSQGIPAAVGALLGYELSEHGDRKKVEALAQMQTALAGRKDEAAAVAVALLRDAYFPWELFGLENESWDLDEHGLVFAFVTTTGRFRVRVSPSKRKQLSARCISYQRRGTR